ncbi:PREDICTED: zinc finger BED domain-containing protein RICESLEEPER 2-like [Camelina sativa]|uniref:Zinc finger BED domain-containing protein RICESLEEPER 2-like n=1 Tax=Camelina sativa TaxID=90675 RepID=A0ABM1QQJ7_CAMSA|nr:PREDICTED: zinc finger BED domain-containing protein RICESLEEPER 2-like [Camelina sativa]
MDSSNNHDANDENTQGQGEGQGDRCKMPPPSDKSKGKRKEAPRGDDDGGKPKKKSLVCPTKQGTSNLKKHLDTCKPYKAWKGRQTQAVISDDGKLQDGRLTESVFREASNEMLVLAELPLAFIECMAWRHFCNKCNLFKPHSRRTASRDIIQMFSARKASLKAWLSSQQHRVSLTTDIWTAKVTRASYMVITVHFVDAEWRLRKLILGFKYITDHKSNTISKVLLECLVDWGIEKLFTITVDNATANSNGLKKFVEEFKLLRHDSLVLDGTYLHVRCCAHIINLIVRDGLSEVGDNVAAVRNGVQYVRSSGPRCDSFEQKVVSGKMTRGSLPMDMRTRWNSTYLMLTRAMKFRLAFQKMEDEDKLYNDYFLELVDGVKRKGPPSYTDWRAIERLVKFLGLFYTATLVVSASTKTCSYKCYGEIVTIEKNLTTLSNSYDSELSKMAIEMREKFTKYWEGIKNINKMLIVASVFDPRQKMQFAKMCFDKLLEKIVKKLRV